MAPCPPPDASSSSDARPKADDLGIPDRRARTEWVELFFDLGVVAAISVLTADLHEESSLEALGSWAISFTAIGLSWLVVVMYANSARAVTRFKTIAVALNCVLAIAASNPLEYPSRAWVFTAAFIVLRMVVSRSLGTTGTFLRSFPLQFGGVGLVLWVISFFVPAPWKHLVWAVALVIDLVFVVTAKPMQDEDLRQLQVRGLQHKHRQAERKANRAHKPTDGPHTREEITNSGNRWLQMGMVDVDSEHLQERLGLFFIIVLGEIFMQIGSVASNEEWNWPLSTLLARAFALIVGLWWMTFSVGFAGSAQSHVEELGSRIALPSHLFSMAGVAVMAVASEGQVRGIRARVRVYGPPPRFGKCLPVTMTAHCPPEDWANRWSDMPRWHGAETYTRAFPGR
ncbi:low temperature requirement protein A [Curtobacterium sp. S6]|uniref:low temperature requirement protein A n=1 Tax=Curtobacterium sp. S6 TaxID=1479623 RepID=UPI0004A9F949|nr:low temperature requirement protein A [Curtobacterium sp. S6]